LRKRKLLQHNDSFNETSDLFVVKINYILVVCR